MEAARGIQRSTFAMPSQCAWQYFWQCVDGLRREMVKKNSEEIVKGVRGVRTWVIIHHVPLKVEISWDSMTQRG